MDPRLFWALAYIQAIGMLLHPRYELQLPQILEQAATIADGALEEFNARI